MSFNPVYKTSFDTLGNNQRASGTMDVTGALRVRNILGGAGANGTAVSATFPAAAAAYLANDVISTAKEFVLLGPSIGGPVTITSSELLVEHTAVISGETSYRLHMYNVTPPSALADNGAWDLPSGDRASYLGFLDLGTVVDVGSSLYVQVANHNRQILVPSGGSIFAYLMTIGAFTPTASNRIVKLHTVFI